MKIKTLFNYYLKNWLFITGGLLALLIIMDVILPMILGLITGENYNLKLVTSELYYRSYGVVFFITFISLIKIVYGISAQFNISRKTQYIVNLTAIILFALSWVAILNIAYTEVLKLLFSIENNGMGRVLSDDTIVNYWLNHLLQVVKLLFIGLLAWFIVAQVKRYSRTKVIFACLFLILMTFTLFFSISSVIPNRIQNDIWDFTFEFFNTPVYLWGTIVISLVFSLYIIHRATRRLSLE